MNSRSLAGGKRERERAKKQTQIHNRLKQVNMGSHKEMKEEWA